MKRKLVRVNVFGKELLFETGQIARQAGGSVVVRCGDTVVFSSLCYAPTQDAQISFSPLRVDYQEKFSSNGKTVGGFIKREGRPSEKETLVSRLIDRSLRPLFFKELVFDMQSLSMVWSYDKQSPPEPLAICAASAALALSSVPTKANVGAVRICLLDGRLIINPSSAELLQSTFECTISGTRYGLTMIEGNGKVISEQILFDAASLAIKTLPAICEGIDYLQKEFGDAKIEVPNMDLSLSGEIANSWSTPIEEAVLLQSKKDRHARINELRKTVVSSFPEEAGLQVRLGFEQLLQGVVRNKVVKSGQRLDGRSHEEIRPISITSSLLPKTHGSALFTRGETQSLAVCTLGSEQMSQRFETLEGEGTQRFYLHYFFPGFCVGEISKVGTPGRRELGHGKLAEKAIETSLPEKSTFPYVIRLESTITESSGSSSMASVCSGSLALMDAGVPIKFPVAGIAMGLFLNEEKGTAEAILSDISEMEDMMGDMDFKMAGNADGFTALQMDVKVKGIPLDVLQQAIRQSQKGISKILKSMLEACNSVRKELPDHVPKIGTVRIPLHKIASLIGPGGKTIRSISEQSQSEITIEDTTGVVYISGSSQQSIAKAERLIQEVTANIVIGKLYNGKIKSVTSFGLFIEILPGKEGLCHVSEFLPTRGGTPNFRVGDMIDVRVLEINAKGQIKLTQRV